MPPERTIVCITGMHRSGTSFAAQALQLLGVDLGAEQALMGPGPDNPAGYYENRQIKELDDELLAHLGGSWDQPPTLAPGWERDPSLDAYQARARAIVHDAFDMTGTGPIGFKDPRLSLLLPFWRAVLPVTATVVLVRDPTEVIASLGRRKKAVEPTQAALLWLRYLLAATRNDPGHLLVHQSEFFTDLVSLLQRMTDHVGLAVPTPAVVNTIRERFDPALHHRADRAGTGPVEPTGSLASVCEWLWQNGRLDLAALPPPITDALAFGWLRAPGDGHALAEARAEATSFKEQLKRRNELVRELRAAAQ